MARERSCFLRTRSTGGRGFFRKAVDGMPKSTRAEAAKNRATANALWLEGLEVKEIALRMRMSKWSVYRYLDGAKDKRIPTDCPSCGMKALEVFTFRGKPYCDESAPGKRDGCFCAEHLPELTEYELHPISCQLGQHIDWRTTDEMDREGGKRHY